MTLSETITPTVIPPNEALAALFSPPIIFVETPIAIRFALLLLAATHQYVAACHPVALSFFGTKDFIPARFCKSPDANAYINALLYYRILESEFPMEAATWGAFLTKNGVDIFDTSSDTNTKAGWANVMIQPYINYFKSDGWNSQGDLSKRNFRNQYEDYSGYKPENHAALMPDELRRPLRWQPLTSHSDSRGKFSSQIHVVPQIATSVKPLVLSQTQFMAREVSSPFKNPNRRTTLSKTDEKKSLELIQRLFKRSQKVNNEKIALAYFWEGKVASLGSFIPFYRVVFQYDLFTRHYLSLAEGLAQHDAALVAWKEKRRHDLVRPPTLIKRLLKGKKVRAWRGIGQGIGIVKAEEWQPIIPIQPHSEFPSASATICSAALENLEFGLNHLVLKGNGTIPPFSFNLSRTTVPNYPFKDSVFVTFGSPADAIRSCGQSRLDSGVHFGPSVPAGHKLGKGIGRASFEHVTDLMEGRVPKNCARCIR